MNVTRRKFLALVILITIAAALIPPSPIQWALAQEQAYSGTRLRLVKLWSVAHDAYMAKFIGEDYVVVFTGHGDVSLDGKYICVYGGDAAYLYTVDGDLVSSFTTDSDGDCWSIENGTKVWDRSGFFSGDSKRMVEDVFNYGTDARVVDVEKWSAIPIEWNFTAPGNNFYAAQLDYSGATLAVGYIGGNLVNDTSKLLIFRYDPETKTYKKIFEHVEYGDYGRRLQLTLDGRVVLVGGTYYPYLDIFIWDDTKKTYVRIIHHRLPDTGGIRALGISDPWKVGYIMVGTQNGWAVVAHFDPETKEFSVLYQEKFAPDNSVVYNPFYERWIPVSTDILVACTHRDSSTPGYGFVYIIPDNESITFKFADPGSPLWSAAAISTRANYVFIGNTLYMVLRPDPGYVNIPRLRFLGTARYPASGTAEWHLNETLRLKFPGGAGWDGYYRGGRLNIRRLWIQAVPVDLITDPVIRRADLVTMWKRGLVNTTTYYTENTEVLKTDVVTGYMLSDQLMALGIENYENYLMPTFSIRFVPPPYFWEGHAWYGTVIHVPLEAPLKPYQQ
ncbi:MAG: hypothetical protein ACTSVD_09605, partial [Candidatus Thorarchaeota archaeon]